MQWSGALCGRERGVSTPPQACMRAVILQVVAVTRRACVFATIPHALQRRTIAFPFPLFLFLSLSLCLSVPSSTYHRLIRTRLCLPSRTSHPHPRPRPLPHPHLHRNQGPSRLHLAGFNPSNGPVPQPRFRPCYRQNVSSNKFQS